MIAIAYTELLWTKWEKMENWMNQMKRKNNIIE